MKSLINNDAEKTAQRLGELSSIKPDKRDLLREIVHSAPENLAREGRLNNLFAPDIQFTESESSHKTPALRMYAGMAVVFVVLLGTGLVWFGWQNRIASNTAQQSSQISANGKVANAVSAISQQAQTELQTVQSANIDNTNLDSINTQLGQMQEVVNEKF